MKKLELTTEQLATIISLTTFLATAEKSSSQELHIQKQLDSIIEPILNKANVTEKEFAQEVMEVGISMYVKVLLKNV
jgi:hypothetical protein